MTPAFVLASTGSHTPLHLQTCTHLQTYEKILCDLDLRRELAWDPGKDAGLALAPVISSGSGGGALMIPGFLFPVSPPWPGDHPDPGCFPAAEDRQPLTH